MPITVEEKAVSRPRWAGDQKSVDLLYVIRGTDDDAAALAALEAEAPATYGGLTRLTYGVEPVGPDLWDGTARYGPAGQSALDDLDIGDVVFSVRSGGGSEHIVVPIARLGAYAPEGETPPKADLIGDDGQGHAEGVDIHGWQYEFTVTKIFASGLAAPAEPVLAALANCVNTDTFAVTDCRTGRSISAAAGECLFLGHEAGTARADGAFELNCNFAIRPNRAEFTIPGTTMTIACGKPGWHYLWCRPEPAEDTDAKRLYARAAAAFVDQVYHLGDFSQLGI